MAHIKVVEGTLLKLRTKNDTIVLGLSFQCSCGRINRVKAHQLVGQNDTTVQLKCRGCKSIVNLPKKREDIQRALVDG